MAVFMSILTWELMLEFKSGMVILDAQMFFMLVFFFRKLFEPQKFPGSILSQIFRKFFFKNPVEFENIENIQDQARKVTHTKFADITFQKIRFAQLAGNQTQQLLNI